MISNNYVEVTYNIPNNISILSLEELRIAIAMCPGIDIKIIYDKFNKHTIIICFNGEEKPTNEQILIIGTLIGSILLK